MASAFALALESYRPCAGAIGPKEVRGAAAGGAPGARQNLQHLGPAPGLLHQLCTLTGSLRNGVNTTLSPIYLGPLLLHFLLLFVLLSLLLPFTLHQLLPQIPKSRCM